MFVVKLMDQTVRPSDKGGGVYQKDFFRLGLSEGLDPPLEFTLSLALFDPSTLLQIQHGEELSGLQELVMLWFL